MFGRVAISPNGQALAAASQDRSTDSMVSAARVRLVSTATGEELMPARELDTLVEALSFNGDGTLLAAQLGLQSNEVVVWRSATGETFARILDDRLIRGISFVSRGARERLLTMSDGNGRIWAITHDDLRDEACARVTLQPEAETWRRYVGDAVPFRNVCPR